MLIKFLDGTSREIADLSGVDLNDATLSLRGGTSHENSI